MFKAITMNMLAYAQIVIFTNSKIRLFYKCVSDYVVSNKALKRYAKLETHCVFLFVLLRNLPDNTMLVNIVNILFKQQMNHGINM